MNFLFFIFLYFNAFFSINAQVYECPNYELLNKPRDYKKKQLSGQIPLPCNVLMTNPKKVINPYRNEIRNYVEAKPFGSICFKCSMCLAVAKEVHKIFQKISKSNKESKQTEVVNVLREDVKDLCHYGFDNYDLRRFNQIQVVTNDFGCNTHVRTKMDGQWTDKLREMCKVYADYMDHQILLNDYLKGTDNITSYLCKGTGIFRDCTNLNFTNLDQDKC